MPQQQVPWRRQIALIGRDWRSAASRALGVPASFADWGSARPQMSQRPRTGQDRTGRAGCTGPRQSWQSSASAVPSDEWICGLPKQDVVSSMMTADAEIAARQPQAISTAGSLVEIGPAGRPQQGLWQFRAATRRVSALVGLVSVPVAKTRKRPDSDEPCSPIDQQSSRRDKVLLFGLARPIDHVNGVASPVPVLHRRRRRAPSNWAPSTSAAVFDLSTRTPTE